MCSIYAEINYSSKLILFNLVSYPPPIPPLACFGPYFQEHVNHPATQCSGPGLGPPPPKGCTRATTLFTCHSHSARVTHLLHDRDGVRARSNQCAQWFSWEHPVQKLHLLARDMLELAALLTCYSHSARVTHPLHDRDGVGPAIAGVRARARSAYATEHYS